MTCLNWTVASGRPKQGVGVMVRPEVWLAVVLLSVSGVSHGWEGQESDTGDLVEIESGNLVRPGEEIEVFNYEEGSYDFYEVETMNRIGGQVEVEVYDYEEGVYKTLIMDD